MEAVTANLILFVVLVGDCIHIGACRHCLVESCIENSYLGNTGHNLFASFNTHKVCRVVERSEGEALTDSSLNVFCYELACCELHTAVENTVTYCIDFIHACNYTVLSTYKLVENSCDSFGVCGESHIFIEYGLTVYHGCVLEVTVNTDTLAQTLCDDGLVVHIEELILKGRAACVDNKNFHLSLPLDIIIFMLYNIKRIINATNILIHKLKYYNTFFAQEEKSCRLLV